MSIKRSTYMMTGESFFEPEVPIFVNRAFETFELSEHSHEFIEITYVSEGTGVHYIANEAVPVEHGTLFFIPVGQSHVFRPTTPKKDRPLIVYNCLFPSSFLTELLADFSPYADISNSFTDKHLSWFSMRDTRGEYHAMFHEMYREFSAKPPGYMLILSSLVLRIITGLYRHQLQLGISAGDKPQWLTVDEAVIYINNYYATGLTLGNLPPKQTSVNGILAACFSVRLA